jgi:hypothetical protein
MTYRRLLLTAAATSLVLAACNQQPAGPVSGAPIASLPLAEAAPPPEAAAPSASDLPPAPPITRVSTPRQPAYSYIDDAYDLGDAFADSPPDYTVDYDGVQPWVWRSSGGDYRVVEQTPNGEREYFYHDGGNYPFLVRDVDYSYAYDDGQLVEVYDSYGRPYPNYGASLLAIAAQYLFRGQHLHDAAIHDQRQAAYAADWRARRQGVLSAQQRWGQEQQSNPEWRQFHQQNAQRQQPQQVSLQQERTQRQAYVQRIAPVIAAAPAAPPLRDAAPAGERHELAQDRATPPPAGGPSQRPAQAEAVNHARDAAAGQQQGQAQVRDQQRAQADAGRAHDAAQRQQQAAAKTASPARDVAQQQAQATAQAQHQQQAQAAAAGHARDEAQHQQAQNQARDQQKTQVEAANHAHDEVQRQQQAANHAQAEVAHQAQAQTQAHPPAVQAMAQQHQAQAQAAVQQHQVAAQHAQVAQVQHAQAAAQHAAPAAARPPAKPDDPKK